MCMTVNARRRRVFPDVLKWEAMAASPSDRTTSQIAPGFGIPDRLIPD